MKLQKSFDYYSVMSDRIRSGEPVMHLTNGRDLLMTSGFLPLILLLFDRWNLQNAGVWVNSAGADTLHYIYGWRLWPRALWQKKRKRQAKPRPVGETRGGGEERGERGGGGGCSRGPWNEMRFLISPGQVGSLRWSVWSCVGASDRIDPGSCAGNSNGHT